MTVEARMPAWRAREIAACLAAQMASGAWAGALRTLLAARQEAITGEQPYALGCFRLAELVEEEDLRPLAAAGLVFVGQVAGLSRRALVDRLGAAAVVDRLRRALEDLGIALEE